MAFEDITLSLEVMQVLEALAADSRGMVNTDKLAKMVRIVKLRAIMGPRKVR